MNRIAILVLAVLTVPLAGCAASADSSADSAGTMVSRDSVVGDNSATVRVIESTAAPTDERMAPFTVDMQPTLTIGTDAGEEPYLLHRVFDAMRLDDGRIVVSNSGSQELRVFSADGQFERSVGRRGAGPGEFSDYSSMHLHAWADSLLVTDDVRVHVYTQALDTAHTRPFDVTRGAARPSTLGVFANGSLLVLAPDGTGRLGGEPGQILNMGFKLMHYEAEGSFTRSLLSYASRPRYVHKFREIGSYPYVPLTSELLAGAVGDSLVVLRDGLAQLEWYDQQGNLAQIARWARARVAARTLYPEYVDSSMAGFRRGTDREQEARYDAFYKVDLPLPEFAPQYTTLKVDALRRVWLERFRLPGDSGPRRWDVIDTNGQWLGTVALPPRFTLFRATSDYVLGRFLDSLGVERVQQHAIRVR